MGQHQYKRLKTHKGKIILHKRQDRPRDSGVYITTHRKYVEGLTEQSKKGKV